MQTENDQSSLNGMQALTPDALCNLLALTAPVGPIAVKGFAREVKVWKKPGEERPAKIYGRLELGESSIRFELPPQVPLQNDEHVVLFGTLRIKPANSFRTTHEVILVGDVVGNWTPRDEVAKDSAMTLVRSSPRTPLDTLVAKHGLDAIAFLATETAWQDLMSAAALLPALVQCRHVQTNFAQPSQFITDLETLCGDNEVKALVVARGGGEGIETIGDSYQVAAALLSSKRPFYTALGHDKDVLLLDKHADGAFPTPSILGQALVDAVRAQKDRELQEQRENDLHDRYDRAADENARLKRRIDELSSRPEVPSSERLEKGSEAKGRVPIGLWVFLLIVVFMVGRCSH